jgi:hypothetical protein
MEAETPQARLRKPRRGDDSAGCITNRMPVSMAAPRSWSEQPARVPKSIIPILNILLSLGSYHIFTTLSLEEVQPFEEDFPKKNFTFKSLLINIVIRLNYGEVLFLT